MSPDILATTVFHDQTQKNVVIAVLESQGFEKEWVILAPNLFFDPG